MNKEKNAADLVEVIKRLRDPEKGCPWDLKQTHKSLIKYLVEESYELVEALENNDFDAIQEECGDVLLQILLHSQLAKENGHFDFWDVCQTLSNKMIERHPHVFSEDIQFETAEEVHENWKKIKAKKKKATGPLLSSSDVYHPALKASHLIGKKTETVGFDWTGPKEVFAKVEEELEELKQVLGKDKVKTEEELGDLLFSLAQLGRHLDCDPEELLKKANLKFIRRYNALESTAKSKNKDVKNLSREEMEEAWREVKSSESMDS